MAIVDVQHWRCNVCGELGPVFEGTAEAVLPEAWLIGELAMVDQLSNGGVRRTQVAVCPGCVPDMDRKLKVAR